MENAARIQIDQADQRQFLPEERFRAAQKYITIFSVGTWHLLKGSSKQVLGPLLNGTWFGYLSSGPGFGDQDIFEQVLVLLKLAPPRGPQSKSWDLFLMRRGLGIYLQDLDFGDEAFEQILYQSCTSYEVIKTSLGTLS